MIQSRYTNGRSCVIEAISLVLTEHGPMTRADICRAIGKEPIEIASVITRLSRRHRKLGKRIYIHDWVRDDDTSKTTHWRAVYALGDKPNKTKPQIHSKAEKNKRYREAKKMKVRSVFDLGIPVKDRVMGKHLKGSYEQP